MSVFRCTNPLCGRMPKGFVFEADKPVCPKCNQQNPAGAFGPFVFELTVVHLLVPHPQGPILGHHSRLYVACQPKRDALARNNKEDWHATADPRVANCSMCLTTDIGRAIAACYPEIAAAEAVEGGTPLLFDPCSK